jgi:hypothetical protein
MQSKHNSKILHSQAREIVSNVRAFMKREAREGIQIPVKNFCKRAANGTGVQSRIVRRVVNERKYFESKEGPSTSISTPGKNKSKPSLKSAVDNFYEEVIRRSIYNFAIDEGERTIVKNLHAKLGPMHTMRHVSVPSRLCHRSVRMFCVHTVRLVQSPSRTARDSFGGLRLFSLDRAD